MMRLFTACQPA